MVKITTIFHIMLFLLKANVLMEAAVLNHLFDADFSVAIFINHYF
jgi:hypothetical protein